MKNKLETTSMSLHIMAMIFMLFDHLWGTIVPGNDWMTCIGRISFPIFAFMIVEGYFNTKNLKKYIKKIIEAICFSAGRTVTIEELMLTLEISKNELDEIINSMQEEYKQRGIELIKVENGYQLCSKKEYYDYIYPILDKRAKPRLSGASLEVLSIIAYNPRIMRAEIEAIPRK